MDKEEPQTPTSPSNFPIPHPARQESPSALSGSCPASAGEPQGGCCLQLMRRLLLCWPSFVSCVFPSPSSNLLLAPTCSLILPPGQDWWRLPSPYTTAFPLFENNYQDLWALSSLYYTAPVPWSVPSMAPLSTPVTISQHEFVNFPFKMWTLWMLMLQMVSAQGWVQQDNYIPR